MRPFHATGTDDMRASLEAALASASASIGEGSLLSRDEAVGIFRLHLGRQYGEIRQLFETRRLKGIAAAGLLATLTDGVIERLATFAARVNAPGKTVAPPPSFCVCATGGYGAGLLAPFSDIDLLFLTEDELTPEVSAQIEYILYFLWDLGLRVGHATRSIEGCLEAAREDLTVRTTLIDARMLWGSRKLFETFGQRYNPSPEQAAEFIRDKMAERAERHRRFEENPHMVEPNVKEGPGGLRDLQTLNWLGRAALGPGGMNPAAERDGTTPFFASCGLLTEQETNRARRAWNLLWTVRMHLHYIAGRADERLLFDMQPVVGGRMGYAGHGRQVGVERFMRHYFLTAREVMRLTHVLEPAIIEHLLGAPRIDPTEPELAQELASTDACLIDGQIAPIPEHDFEKYPARMIGMLDCARRHRLPLHPLVWQQLIRHERRGVALRGDLATMECLTRLLCAPTREGANVSRTAQPKSGADWAALLSETGLLGAILPDWSRIVGQMQFDTYHIYTVDVHNIEAVRMLGCIEQGRMADEIPLAYALAHDVQSRRALYIATLIHDIAKGRGGDHSELGSEVALQLCPALGLDIEETETVSWLVLHHLLLSQTAFRRDIDDPRTILDLADTIQSPERLRLLLLLTIADTRAVNPTVWNAWKATLLRELYTRVAEVLEGGMAAEERDVRVDRAKEMARDGLLRQGMPAEQVEHFLGLGYAGYWLGFDADTHMRHAHLVAEAQTNQAPVTVEALAIPSRDITEITTLSADHSGLFSLITGALAVAGASIVDARIHTLSDGMALDTFWVQNAQGHAFETSAQLGRLRKLVNQSLAGVLNVDREIERVSQHRRPGRRMRAIHVPPRVVIDNGASDRYTIIEVNGRDRPGLLHDVTQAISEQNLQISSAHVTTYGVRAVDVFYVRDLDGKKIIGDARIAEIRGIILEVLRKGESASLAREDAA
ncbi:[protein-PII] uridylyltransferase [Brytella acorum]|uniref:Bifunctional uridylyltransferase/uridylyl-removing enzyme n=1 Tax=Brytella acorum TaxID=2959299 RepID=A0AA35VDA3_9PROT|nr:[protein-PII] uridylyltransferase [Brytella acorum]MDF3624238.1 [protein-PII] uridylyltransferase [Brytella acorum]CAI9121188.1 [protein-PII] uridylyltransferase [Brytella acorum]